ncbi:MAG: dihydropteroate synthase-like protein [Candidatus Methanoperedens sp.]|nr:dihydropteroate synthase-like protein [Candidatus Methanoperedens sp.]
MNILVVTGKLAENTARKSVNDKADILVLDIEVAAFTTPALLRRSLPQKKYDLILIPGMSPGDFSGLEKELDIPIRLGPKHAVDLGFVLSFAGSFDFSTKIPACELLIEIKRSTAIDKAIELEKVAVSPLTLRSVKIGGNSRMKVMAEIVDAGNLEKNDLIRKIIYFVESGADIIDLGMSLDTSRPDVREAVETAKSVTDIPLSVDTLEPDLINAALDAGIDIVLSLNSKNIGEVKDGIIKNFTISVIIPDRSDDLESLYNNMESARSFGIKNIIADPVLEPAGHGLSRSISRYNEFRERDRTTPLFFGVGNVTELIDADSIGVNSILCGIAMELGASILFTPEFSQKAYGSVSELKTASTMMMLSQDRGSAPKDLGVNMLAIKEKRRREYGKIPENYIDAKGSEKWHLDPAGCFKVEITDDEIRNGKLCPGKIMVRNDNKNNANNINMTNDAIVGSTAKEILDTIIERGLISRLDHAAYLGRELMKAELALKFKRSYSQDDKF